MEKNHNRLISFVVEVSERFGVKIKRRTLVLVQGLKLS